MSEHTAGPWTFEPETSDPSKPRGPAIWANGMLIANVAGWADFDYANGRLIAASPKLLEACEKYAIPALDEAISRIRESGVDAVDLMSIIHCRNFVAVAINEAKGVKP